jgi:hypothetical protein
MELISLLKRLHERYQEEDSCTDDSEEQVMNGCGNGIFLLGYITGT